MDLFLEKYFQNCWAPLGISFISQLELKPGNLYITFECVFFFSPMDHFNFRLKLNFFMCCSITFGSLIGFATRYLYSQSYRVQ